METRREGSVTRGILLLISSSFLFALAWLTVKHVSGTIPLFEIIFFRSSIGTLLIFLFIIGKRQPLRGKNKRLLYLRSLIGLISLALAFYAISLVKVGDVATLTNTFPFFVALLAPPILGERFRKDIILWIIIAFIGVILILKPGPGILHNVALLALVVGLLNAFSQIFVKKLHQTDHPLTIAFYFMWTTTLISIPFLIGRFVWPTPQTLLFLLFIGISIAFGQILMTYAYKFGPATVISPFNYSLVLFTYIGGILFLSEIPDFLDILGASIVVVSGIAITYQEGRREALPSSQCVHM